MLRSIRNLLILPALATLAFFAPLATLADVTASVLGTITDSTARVVANATVKLSNSGTGYQRSVTTDVNGSYEFLSVPVGDGYSIAVTSAAFAKSVKEGITLQVNQSFRADFTLSVGQVREQVTVLADSVQVDTTTNQLGDLISDKKMIGLPLNGRSYTDLMGLQPGVVPITSSAAFTDRPVSGELNAGGVSVNGSQESGNSFLINGGDVEEPKNSGASVIPTLDSIQEFRILTNTFDAEYGRFGGAIVNVVTKTGTNQFHGSAYEFLRNEKLNAKNYFDQDQVDPSTQLPIPNSARGVFKRNQFGFTFGGPALRNRVFFFSDYQGTREVRGQTASVAFVPSTSEMAGDFSDAAATGFGTLTGTVQGDPTPGEHTMPETLTARLGYTVTSGEPYWFAGCTSTTDCVFPGQKIPQAAWDPAAVGTLKFIPAPTGLRGTTPFYSTSSLENRLNDDKIGERVTWSNRRTGDWSFYMTYDNASSENPFAGGNVPQFPGSVPQKAWQGNASDTRVFGPSMVNEVRLNYTRSTIFQTHPEGPGLGPLSGFGFSTGPLGLISSVPSVEGVPSINIGGAYGVSMGVVAYAINQVNNEYQLLEAFSKVIGRHSLKFGGEGRQIHVSEYNISTPNGSFSFNGAETGNGFADYLLGAPNSFAQQSYSTFFTEANYGGFFVQDAFRARPNLTINAGLRYELIQPFYEIENRLNAIVWGLQSTVYPGSPTGWVFPGDAGLPNTISKTPHDNFSPRLGINWSPGAGPDDGLLGKLAGGAGKTSIRAGSGIYYTAIEDQPSFYTIGDAPFGLYYQSPTQVYFSSPYEDRRHGNDPGQHFPFTPPTPGSPVDWSKYLPIGGSPGVNPGNRTPYVIQFNLNVQRELPGAAILSASYVGTRGHHLLAQVESNPGIAASCLQIAAELPVGQGCGPYGEDQIYALPGGGSADGTRIHSVTSGRFLSQGLLDFTSNPYNTTIVNSDYNALQLSVVKHLGFSQFLASYTWSKSIDDGSGDTDSINPFFPRRSRALSAFDMGHNFVVSYGVELPGFRTQRALVRKPLGGWELTGITRFTTGLPITMSENMDQSLSGLRDTPDWDGKAIAKSNPRSTSARTYFNSDQFSLQALGTFGSSSQRFFHGPGLDNWDVALRKSTQIYEGYSLEFRAEFFNVFNHTQFNNPDGNQSAADFGEVSTARDPRIGQVALRFAF